MEVNPLFQMSRHGMKVQVDPAALSRKSSPQARGPMQSSSVGLEGERSTGVIIHRTTGRHHMSSVWSQEPWYISPVLLMMGLLTSWDVYIQSLQWYPLYLLRPDKSPKIWGAKYLEMGSPRRKAPRGCTCTLRCLISCLVTWQMNHMKRVPIVDSKVRLQSAQLGSFTKGYQPPWERATLGFQVPSLHLFLVGSFTWKICRIKNPQIGFKLKHHMKSPAPIDLIQYISTLHHSFEWVVFHMF